MKGVLEKIQRYLDDGGVAYEVIHHKPAASAEEYHQTLGTRYEQQAKAAFLRYKRSGEKGFVVLTLQAQKRVDMDRMKQLLGAKEVKMATKEQLEEVTNCTFGELPPFGKLFGLQLFMDKDLLDEPKVYFNAGDLSTSLVTSPEAIRRLEEAELY